jgi:hypothetical protein
MLLIITNDASNSAHRAQIVKQRKNKTSTCHLIDADVTDDKLAQASYHGSNTGGDESETSVSAGDSRVSTVHLAVETADLPFLSDVFALWNRGD